MIRHTTTPAPKLPTLVPAALAILFLALAALSPLAAPPAEAEVINRIVLRVNNRIATLEDYEDRRSQLLNELMQQPNLTEEQQLRALESMGERVFQDIYEELLLLSRADQMEIQVTAQQLDTVVDQMQEEMNLPDRRAFRQAVEQSGITMEEFEDQWRRQLRMREVINREIEWPIQDELSEQQLRLYYRQHPEEFEVPAQARVREVVVLEDSGLPEDERRALAGEIRAAVAAGQDLAEVVAEHAEAGRTSKVIDLGWVRPGELAPSLEEAVFNLEAGAVSQPLPARGGLHLCLVEERKEAALQPFEEVANRIRGIERRRLRDERLPAYMDELEELAFIRMNPPEEARGFRRQGGSMAEDLPEMPESLQEAPAEGATGEGTTGEGQTDEEAGSPGEPGS